MHHYIDITHEPDSFELPVAPSVFYLIYSLEIVVRDSSDCYLLLSYSTYAFENEEIRDCIWSPPFSAFDVTPRLFSIRDAGHVKRQYDQAEARIDEDEEVKRRLYLLGAQGADFSHVGDVLEYKSSPSEPERIKCYKIKRYRVSYLTSLGMLNVVDPENLKGHYFLPLTLLDTVLLARASSTDRYEWYFRGKPVAEHVVKLLSQQNEVRRLVDQAIPIPKSMFLYDEEGLLIRFDISGYGQLCDYVRHNMHTFDVTGPSVEGWLNGKIYKTFMAQIARCGTMRIRLEGDGFVAAVPKKYYPNGNVVEAVVRIVESLASIRVSLAGFNSSIPDIGLHIDSRAAIMEGAYRYGRVGELASDGAEFEGPSITAVCRLEEGLKHYIQKCKSQASEEKESRPSLDESNQYPNLVFDARLYTLAKAKLDAMKIDFIGEQEVNVKEYSKSVAMCVQRISHI